jgi:hypothetical protein
VHKVYWLWRDLRLLYVLLVWAAFGASLFYVFDKRIVFRGTAIVLPHRTASARLPQAQSDDEFYTGAVIVVQPCGDRCWQMTLDNRTGRMWENSCVDCPRRRQ